MWKYQYDDEYTVAVESGDVFLSFEEMEDEECFARTLRRIYHR